MEFSNLNNYHRWWKSLILLSVTLAYFTSLPSFPRPRRSVTQANRTYVTSKLRQRKLTEKTIKEIAFEAKINIKTFNLLSPNIQGHITNSTMELDVSRQNCGEKCLGTPAIQIVHHCKRHSTLRVANSKLLPPSFALTKWKTSTQTRVKPSTTSNEQGNCDVTAGSPSESQCYSLTLPLEVELNVLGVVEQGVIDRGQTAKLRRNGSINYRNNMPDKYDQINLEERQRPRSFSSSSDFQRTKLTIPILKNARSLPSTTLCSTELWNKFAAKCV